MSDLMTLDEVADMLRASPASVRYWRHLGTGPASYKVGRRVVYSRADVLSWLEAQRTAGGAA